LKKKKGRGIHWLTWADADLMERKKGKKGTGLLHSCIDCKARKKRKEEKKKE